MTFGNGFMIGFGLCALINAYFVFVLYEKPRPEFTEIAYEINREIDMPVTRLSLKDIEEMM